MSPRSHLLATAPQSELTAEARDALALTDEARAALLARLEAWIAEEERLVDAIERRVAALGGKVVPFPGSPAAGGGVGMDAGAFPGYGRRTIESPGDAPDV